MSLTSKITLAVAAVFGAGTTIWVFYKQEEDRAKMHQGVVKDLERQRLSKLQKSQNLDKQVIVSAENSDDKVLRELVGANKS